MTKTILNKEQLNLVKLFIASKSLRYTEPAVMLAIFDHFACVVEEIWTGDNTLSLEAAIDKAYEVFGKEGFAQIAASVERQILNKYRRFANAELKRLLQSIPGAVIISVAAMLYFFIVLNYKSERGYSGIYSLIALIQASHAATFFYRAKQRKAYLQHHPLLLKATSVRYPFFVIYTLPLIIGLPFAGDFLMPGTISILLAYSIFSFMIQTRYLEKARTEASDIEQQLAAA